MADFSGVTFAKQNVTPADDGLIRRALLSDGILTGCNFSYSGYTLSMRAGALIVCGRQIRHPSAQNWAVVGAKSGYARLVLDIDLTKSSTKELFEQVSTILEYATDEAGFTELIQEDLNVSGSHYQIALCVVSLGEAGITGIVSQLDAAAGGGGGNFNVVGGLTQPTSPKNNTIWVRTNVTITSYHISPTQPVAPSEGLVWIKTGDSGTGLTAGGKNTLTIYPQVAMIYSGDAWQSLLGAVYKDKTWTQFGELALYKNGVFGVTHTEMVANGSVVYADAYYSAKTKGQNLVCESYVVFGPVSLDGLGTITMRAQKNDTQQNTTFALVVAQSPTAGRDGAAQKTEQNVTKNNETTVSLDVSALSGDGWYVYAGTNTIGAKWANARTVDVYEVTIAS